MRESLQSVWRQTGVKPQELDELHVLPDSCTHVWRWFIDLHNARSGNGFGANPISYTEMKSYFYLMNISPSEWEIELIKKLDNEMLLVFAKQNSK